MLLVLIASATLVFTACEDESIAHSLEGTWEGNTYMASIYNGYTYNSTYSYVNFNRDPYRYSSGKGFWVDYYSNAPWDYIASHIEWKVSNRVIEVYFVEDHFTIYIDRYRLNDNHFYGTIYMDSYDWDFDLIHTGSPNWNDYRFGTGSYAPACDKGATPPGRPQRALRVK